MTTLQDYECPEHGRFETTVHGDVPDEVPCQVPRCALPSHWVPCAPVVHTHETHMRAMTSLARDSNPW